MGGSDAGASVRRTETVNTAEDAWKKRFARQFHKTAMCKFWAQHHCSRGSTCEFAHGEHELQKRPSLDGTAQCPRMVAHGQCGVPGCQFAHSLDVLRATETFYKTKMCVFHRAGGCRLGVKCRYAHSESELRPAPRTHEEAASIDGQGREATSNVDDSQWARVRTTPAALSSDHGMGMSRAEDPPEQSIDKPMTWQRIKCVPRSMHSEHLTGRRSRTGLLGCESAAGQLDTMATDAADGFDQGQEWARMVSTPADVRSAHAPAFPGCERADAHDEFGGGRVWARMVSTPADFQPNHATDTNGRRADALVTGEYSGYERADAHDEFGGRREWSRMVSTQADFQPNQATDTNGRRLDALVTGEYSGYEHVDTDDEFDPPPKWRRARTMPANFGPNRAAGTTGGGADELVTRAYPATPTVLVSEQESGQHAPGQRNRVQTEPLRLDLANLLVAGVPGTPMLVPTAVLPQKAAGSWQCVALLAWSPAMPKEHLGTPPPGRIAQSQ